MKHTIHSLILPLTQVLRLNLLFFSFQFNNKTKVIINNFYLPKSQLPLALFKLLHYLSCPCYCFYFYYCYLLYHMNSFLQHFFLIFILSHLSLFIISFSITTFIFPFNTSSYLCFLQFILL